MKIFLRFYSVFFILIIVVTFDGCTPKQKDEVPEDRTLVSGTKYVVLLVDVDKIRPNSKGRDFCNFPVNYPYPSDSIENYTTDILPGDTVVWLGVSTIDPIGDTILIEQIKHFSGDSVLGPIKGINGKAVGIIKNSAERNQKEKYVIKFRVKKEGIPSKNFQIDPKLLVH
jgi:hypothetical protein